MVRLAVSGSASRSVPAERGTVRLLLSLEAEQREPVVRGVGALHERFAAEAEEQVRTGAATWWRSEQVRVWSEHRFAADSDRVVHLAAAEVLVRFRDFAALATWLAAAGSEPGVDVGGIEWSVTDHRRSAVQREVRVQAVSDAIDRARDYAHALGASDVQIEQLWEPGLRPGAAPDGGDLLLARAKAEGGTGGIELRPRDIEISASITADFVTR